MGYSLHMKKCAILYFLSVCLEKEILKKKEKEKEIHTNKEFLSK